MKYDVTIGIPLYKSEAYIRQAFESALVQSYPSIEYLIIDDCGQDGSVAIVEEIKAFHRRGKDVKIISRQQNMGVSASRNQIIAEAQGDYLYFMDSDDTISENTIELLMRNVQQYNAEIAFGSYEKIEFDGNRTVYQYPTIQLLEKDQLAIFAYRKYGGIQASACNYLVKTSLLREKHFQFIDSDYWEDMAFTFNLVTDISRAVLLPDITYHYYCRENSLSRYHDRDIINKEEICRNIKVVDYLKQTSLSLYNKEYFPNRCCNIVMTDFYIACNILKRRYKIQPQISNKEIKEMMRHPATWCQICHFKQSRLINILLFLLGKMPPSLCVFSIWSLGKLKKLV